MAISIHPSEPPAGEQPKNAKSGQLGRLSTKRAQSANYLADLASIAARASLQPPLVLFDFAVGQQIAYLAPGRPDGSGLRKNSALGEHLVNGGLLPVPRVELVENPAFGGAVGVRESSCTTYQRPHSALNQFRPSTTSPPTSTLSLRRLPSPVPYVVNRFNYLTEFRGFA